MRPLIGLTAGTPPVDVPAAWLEPSDAMVLAGAYWRAVWEAGGMPVILPSLAGDGAAPCLGRLDGLILTGGPDPDPCHFGEEPRPENGRIDPERDEWELALIRGALAADLPLMAICRGMQMLNVAAGGNIHQDIPSRPAGRVKHYQAAPRWYPTHRISVRGGTLLARLLTGDAGGHPEQTSYRVNSFHHQAVLDAAPGFTVTALADDGIPEAMESRAHSFVLGVQWHPEGMWPRDGGSLNLFRGLVEAARSRRVRSA